MAAPTDPAAAAAAAAFGFMASRSRGQGPNTRGRGRGHSHGNSAPVDQSNNCTLHVTKIDPSLNNEHSLRAHFAQFGTVKNLSWRPSYTTVEFAAHDQALQAKSQGTSALVPSQDQPATLRIYWHNHSRQRSNVLVVNADSETSPSPTSPPSATAAVFPPSSSPFGSSSSGGSSNPFGQASSFKPASSFTPASLGPNKKPASPFGAQPSTSPFGTQPSTSPFGAQPSTSPFGSAPQATLTSSSGGQGVFGQASSFRAAPPTFGNSGAISSVATSAQLPPTQSRDQPRSFDASQKSTLQPPNPTATSAGPKRGSIFARLGGRDPASAPLDLNTSQVKGVGHASGQHTEVGDQEDQNYDDNQDDNNYDDDYEDGDQNDDGYEDGVQNDEDFEDGDENDQDYEDGDENDEDYEDGDENEGDYGDEQDDGDDRDEVEEEEQAEEEEQDLADGANGLGADAPVSGVVPRAGGSIFARLSSPPAAKAQSAHASKPGAVSSKVPSGLFGASAKAPSLGQSTTNERGTSFLGQRQTSTHPSFGGLFGKKPSSEPAATAGDQEDLPQEGEEGSDVDEQPEEDLDDEEGEDDAVHDGFDGQVEDMAEAENEDNDELTQLPSLQHQLQAYIEPDFDRIRQQLETRNQGERDVLQRRRLEDTFVYVEGTCNDMCPELERYARINCGSSDTNGHVWQLEMSNGKPDHRRMVKEYRKEAADSVAEPPSSLRPPRTLTLTMRYLMKEVMDAAYAGPPPTRKAQAVWYEFLENRLRALRKDIKTQNLTTTASLRVLEQCVRFHLFADWYMSNSREFIQNRKLNHDRLKDSYGMLEMHYKDLRDREPLPNEGELMSYQLLLNLGQPSILRKVKHLQHDPHVQAAIRIFATITDLGAKDDVSKSALCNHARFFRLLRQATFLQACIASHHFEAVRLDALFQIRSGYRKLFPGPDTLVRILGLDNVEQLRTLGQAFGCSVTDQGLASMANLAQPEPSARPVMRAEWIDGLRRGVDLSQIIGGPDSPVQDFDFRRHSVHDSFRGAYTLFVDAVPATKRPAMASRGPNTLQTKVAVAPRGTTAMQTVGKPSSKASQLAPKASTTSSSGLTPLVASKAPQPPQPPRKNAATGRVASKSPTPKAAAGGARVSQIEASKSASSSASKPEATAASSPIKADMPASSSRKELPAATPERTDTSKVDAASSAEAAQRQKLAAAKAAKEAQAKEARQRAAEAKRQEQESKLKAMRARVRSEEAELVTTHLVKDVLTESVHSIGVEVTAHFQQREQELDAFYSRYVQARSLRLWRYLLRQRRRCREGPVVPTASYDASKAPSYVPRYDVNAVVPAQQSTPDDIAASLRSALPWFEACRRVTAAQERAFRVLRLLVIDATAKGMRNADPRFAATVNMLQQPLAQVAFQDDAASYSVSTSTVHTRACAEVHVVRVARGEYLPYEVAERLPEQFMTALVLLDDAQTAWALQPALNELVAVVESQPCLVLPPDLSSKLRQSFMATGRRWALRGFFTMELPSADSLQAYREDCLTFCASSAQAADSAVPAVGVGPLLERVVLQEAGDMPVEASHLKIIKAGVLKCLEEYNGSSASHDAMVQACATSVAQSPEQGLSMLCNHLREAEALVPRELATVLQSAVRKVLAHAFEPPPFVAPSLSPLPLLETEVDTMGPTSVASPSTGHMSNKRTLLAGAESVEQNEQQPCKLAKKVMPAWQEKLQALTAQLEAETSAWSLLTTQHPSTPSFPSEKSVAESGERDAKKAHRIKQGGSSQASAILEDLRAQIRLEARRMATSTLRMQTTFESIEPRLLGERE
ncbi:uncharacterized protein MONBRDRAFT_22671 [Monosiga brevicollis MX1]|uniref:SAC3/GANP/THP3 conserved domain-containing protein n=1 Tax=Monosiga brevicollis TaxID=81824 RepID=A9URQ3_MONBE|nr:uncharacterized protein MONBRDRAFT_22671 [Monosiga brevicollis MX1]EDQ91966.1 predicted protein [Monosiga brevicollis MX1]|eukprot:XP_001743252.1 hypothetical protein [Monosiga brevicollis MX1]